MTGKNPNPDIDNMNAYKNLVKFCPFVQTYWAETKFWDKSRAITLLQMCYDPNLDCININAYTNFGKILSFCSQDIDRKLYLDINQGP